MTDPSSAKAAPRKSRLRSDSTALTSGSATTTSTATGNLRYHDGDENDKPQGNSKGNNLHHHHHNNNNNNTVKTFSQHHVLSRQQQQQQQQQQQSLQRRSKSKHQYVLSYVTKQTLLWSLILVLFILLLFNSFLNQDQTTSSSSSLLLLKNHPNSGRVQEKKQDKFSSSSSSYIIADPTVLKIPHDSSQLAWDPFATYLARQRQDADKPKEVKPKTTSASKAEKAFWKRAKKMLDTFEREYGEYGRSMLTKSVQTVYRSDNNDNNIDGNGENDISALAQALQGKQSLFVVILGNGAAAGYGNYRRQAYSVQLESLLEDLTLPATLQTQTSISVLNLAVDQGAEFPNTWCLASHFLAEGAKVPDVVVYDFTGSTPMRLEAVLRQLLKIGVRIIVARHASVHLKPDAFVRVLNQYCPIQRDQDDVDKENQFLAFDACLWLQPETAVEPYLLLPTTPPGLVGWKDQFGSGRRPKLYHDNDHLDHQRPRYLTVPQHTWIAWSVAMTVLSALQVGAYSIEPPQAKVQTPLLTKDDTNTRLMIQDDGKPLPLPVLLDNSTLDPLILGHNAPSSVQCFTSYEYVVRNSDMTDLDEEQVHQQQHHIDVHIPNNLASIIKSNIIGTAQELLIPKVASTAQRAAWMYDLDSSTKNQKQQMRHNHDQQAFYGMPDWKGAYYGAYQSGVLKLNVPINFNGNKNMPKDDSAGSSFVGKAFLRVGRRRPVPAILPDLARNASALVQAIIFCQSDAPMSSSVSGCSWAHDVQVRIGKALTMVPTKPLDSSYQVVVSTRGGKNYGHVKSLCRRVDVTPQVELVPTDKTKDQEENWILPIHIEVTNPRVLWHSQQSIPCSLSHVLLHFS